ncbi:unnamed protein product [Adineta ricciae]|uniref:Uncharacterized protein n=1 Tax=Adineta ricciae TaxID=249248 RepID=A0A815X0E5_ADIRI|nr:unnamed protein product [Adineta ricciae]CAF1643087.1 unnamed protein product [Adineta ricciae]
MIKKRKIIENKAAKKANSKKATNAQTPSTLSTASTDSIYNRNIITITTANMQSISLPPVTYMLPSTTQLNYKMCRQLNINYVLILFNH